MKKLSIFRPLALSLGVLLTGSAMAYQNPSSTAKQQPTQSVQANSSRMQVSPGAKMKVKGLVLKREEGSFLLRDQSGSELTVRLAGNTKLEEKKSNPFRGSKKYTTAQLVRGLNLEIEGTGDSSGAIVAEKIKFSDDDQRIAQMIDSQVVPIDNRLGQTEDRLTRSEQNAERLSGQVEELGQVANLAKGGARAAQESADAAIEGVNKTNDRISSLDDYEVRKSATINFKVGSAVLTPEAQSSLDDIATQAKTEKAFVIEVRGFASSDGSEDLNRRLSQRRSDAVVRYLAEKYDIPLRRIILPFGYGEAQPVADNATRDGRVQNRRAEVKVLVSRGLTAPVTVDRPVSSRQ